MVVAILLVSGITRANANAHWPEYYQLANQHYAQKQYDSAYVYYFKLAHKQLENIPDSAIAESYRKLGIILYQQKQYEKSVVYFKQAHIHYKKINDQPNAEKCRSNLANVYVQMQEYELAETLYQSCLQTAVKNSDSTLQLMIHLNMGGLYNHTKEFDLASSHLLTAQILAVKLRDTLFAEMTLNNLTTMYLNQFMPDSALVYLRKTASKSSHLNLKKAALKNLYKLNRQLGNMDSAFYYRDQYQMVSDSLKNKKIALTIAQLETELQREKDRAQLATALMWIVVLVVLLLVGLLFWVREKKISKQRLAESKSLTNMFIEQLKVFENEKTEVGSLLHSNILPTLVSVRNLLHLNRVKEGETHLQQSIEKLAKLQNNQFYSLRFDHADWLIYTPTNAKHNSEWIEIQCHHDPRAYTTDFQIAVLSMLEQLLHEGQQKLRVTPDEYGVLVEWDKPIEFSKTTLALFRFFHCRLQNTKLHIPLLENR